MHLPGMGPPPGLAKKLAPSPGTDSHLCAVTRPRAETAVPHKCYSANAEPRHSIRCGAVLWCCRALQLRTRPWRVAG
jgi:hypothetical protein